MGNTVLHRGVALFYVQIYNIFIKTYMAVDNIYLLQGPSQWVQAS